MTRVLSGVVLSAIIVAAASAQRPQFRTGTHTVSVYATALDARGRLVTDLTRDDFEVYDNGVRQDLTVFANDERPITVVVMLDRSGSVSAQFGRVRDAAEAFVDQLHPADKVRIGSFSYAITIDPVTFTSDRDELLDILETRLQEAGPTPLWSATAAAMDALAGQEGRRVVLVFTDGYDSPFTIGMQTTFTEVRDRSRAEDIMVYGIGLAQDCGPPAPAMPTPSGEMFFQRGGQGRGGRGTPPPRIRIPPRPPIGRPPMLPPRQPPRMPDPSPVPSRTTGTSCVPSKPDPELRALTQVGGGGYFELTTADSLSPTFARVAEELHRQYLLGFTAATLDNAVHRLEVRVRRAGVSVRARSEYLAAER